MNASRFQVVGVNDDENFCECCGKSELTRVVWIKDNETSEVKHFGVVCAKSPIKGFDLSKEIDRENRKYNADLDFRRRLAMGKIPKQFWVINHAEHSATLTSEGQVMLKELLAK